MADDRAEKSKQTKTRRIRLQALLNMIDHAIAEGVSCKIAVFNDSNERLSVIVEMEIE